MQVVEIERLLQQNDVQLRHITCLMNPQLITMFCLDR